MNLQEEADGYRVYEMTQIIDEFKRYKTANPFIDYFYVYSKENDFALSYTGKYESRLLYDLYHSQTNGTYEEWLKFINDDYNKEYMLLARKTSTGEVKNSLAYIQSVPNKDIGTYKGTLVIMLDMKQIMQLLGNSKWSNSGTVFIIDENNRILASTSNLPDSHGILSYEKLNAASGSMRNKLDGNDMVILAIDSTVAKWKYVSLIPSEVFYIKAKLVRNVTVISTLFCIVIGSVIAYAFTRKNYGPLKNIVDVIIDKEKIRISKNINEYSFIKNTVLNAIERKNEAFHKLRRQNSVLKTNFLLKLMKGSISSVIPLEESFENYDIKFISDFFAVILFVIEDYGVLEKDGSSHLEDIHLARLMVENVAEELLNRNSRAFIVQEDDIIACLVNIDSERVGSYKEDMMSAIHETAQFIKANCGITCSVAVSQCHQGYYGISLAYSEAMTAMEYRIVMGTGKIIEYDNVMEKSDHFNRHTFSIEVEQRFINCIKAGDFKKAQNMMQEFINENFYKSIMPIQMTKCLMFSMVNTMINAVRELCILYNRDFILSLNPIERLLECKTIEEFEIQMNTILASVEEFIKNSSLNKDEELWKKVIDYIEENYSDINLSVAFLAEHFDVNPSYLVTYFKGKTGSGLLEFINKTRVAKAKQLLLETNTSLNDIAERVGYYSSNTLIRVFKKIEGITPGKFRENSSQP